MTSLVKFIVYCTRNHAITSTNSSLFHFWDDKLFGCTTWMLTKICESAHLTAVCDIKWGIDYSICYFICCSVVSRAILKPVYRSGIPNSNPQTLRSVDFWCKLSSTFLVAEPRERCFELFRTQNSQKFPGFRPWTPLGRAYSATPDLSALQRFFSSLRSSKNWHPQKSAGYGTVLIYLLKPALCIHL